MTELGHFGRYEALEELGSGAMGKVYLAIDPLIDRMVAVKVIRADLLEPADRVEFLERFRLEVRAAARCAHPNIVAVHDFADHEAMPYIVMEHVPGRTVSAILRGDPQERQAAIPSLTTAMLSVLEGLKAAHALGVIHRDIKPGNIMITPRGQVKITDFGIAKFGGGDLTQLGGVVGTPAYMSPEQAHGREVDPRSDLFSVAAILYEIQLGRAPFAGNNMTDTLMRLTSPAPADLGRLAGTPLGEVLRRGLAKDPEARFADAESFAAALRLALAPPAKAPGVAAAPSDPMRRLAVLRGRSPAPPPAAGQDAPRAEPASEASARLAPSLSAGLRLSPAQTAEATAALAFVVGPIARILLGKAVAQASTPAELVNLLCAHASGAEAAALRTKLTALF